MDRLTCFKWTSGSTDRHAAQFCSADLSLRRRSSCTSSQLPSRSDIQLEPLAVRVCVDRKRSHFVSITARKLHASVQVSSRDIQEVHFPSSQLWDYAPDWLVPGSLCGGRSRR